MNKIACQFIFSFTPFNDTWIYCVMLFGFSFWQFWCYTVNEPYYNKKAAKFFKIVSAYYFWTTLMLMVSQNPINMEFQWRISDMVGWIAIFIYNYIIRAQIKHWKIICIKFKIP